MRTLGFALSLITFISLFNPIFIFAADSTSDKQTYNSAKRAINSGQYKEAIEQYKQLLQAHPSSQYSDQSQLEIAYAYYKLGDANDAINTLNQFLADNKNHPHIPYAHYLAGLTHYSVSINLMTNATTEAGENRGIVSASRALNHFSEIITLYPGSQYLDDAKQKSSSLLKKMAMNKITIGSNKGPKQSSINHQNALKWLLEQPGDHFTLQLMRSNELAPLQNLVTEYGLDKNTITIKLNNNDVTTYILIYGTYPTKHKAMEIGSNLPKAVLDSKPQVRAISNIQQEVREHRLLLARNGISAANKPAVKSNTTTSSKLDITPIGKAYRENWLQQQNPDHYTIQISAMDQELSLNKFIDYKKLAGKVAYFRGIRHEKDWYSLLFDSYPSKQAAKQAVAKLKHEHNITDTWIRRFKDIHLAIKKAN